MDDNEDIPPFWLQTNHNHRRRNPPSFLLNSGVLLIFLVVIALAFIFVIIPSFRNFTSQILSPNSVKKGWDSLNIVLVLFAIVCGFLSRNNNSTEDSLSSSSTPTGNAVVGFQDRALSNAQKPSFTNSNGWDDEYSDRRGAALSYRMRSSRSYSDLSQQNLWGQSDNQWRFYDDTHLQSFSLSNSDELGSLDRQDGQDSDAKNIPVDAVEQKKEVVYAEAPSPAQPPIPADESESQLYKSAVIEKEVSKEPLPEMLPEIVVPSPTRGHKTKRRSRRTYADVAEKAKAEPQIQPMSEPLPPPQPLQHRVKHKVRNVEPLVQEVVDLPQEKLVNVVEVMHRTRRSYEDFSRVNTDENEFRAESFQHERARGKHRTTRSYEDVPFREEVEREELRNSGHKSEKKRGNATKDLLNFLNHQRKKKKKQRQRSTENFENLVSAESSLQHSHRPPPSPPPPPPPPPPPASMFHNWLHRKGKTKKVHSSEPLQPRVGSTSKRPPKTRTQVALSQFQPNQVPTARPPLPGSYFAMDDNPSSGNESPLLPIPPPPPLPPFKMPGWKFVRQGDFVRVSSFNSSRSSSPDLDDQEDSPRKEGNESATATMAEKQSGGSSQQASFCPSPDVNSKADMFIERVRAGFKHEKAKSFKENQHSKGKKSRLSRQASPSLDEVGSGQ